jgi:hypothetical protein
LANTAVPKQELGNQARIDELAKSHFPLPWWEGIKGRGKITG